MNTYSAVSAKDIPGSMFKITPDEDVDIELRECFKKAQSLNLHLQDVLNLFQLKTSARISDCEYLIGKCPQCFGEKCFHIVYQLGDYPKYCCAKCHCEKRKGDCLIS